MSDRSMQDGGPAFPFPASMRATGHPGMSLRDWFAGQALAGYLASEQPGEEMKIDRAAADAYRYADAMLAERSKPTQVQG